MFHKSFQLLVILNRTHLSSYQTAPKLLNKTLKLKFDVFFECYRSLKGLRNEFFNGEISFFSLEDVSVNGQNLSMSRFQFVLVVVALMSYVASVTFTYLRTAKTGESLKTVKCNHNTVHLSFQKIVS